MSKKKLEEKIKMELELLNGQIDIRIIKGLPYASIARRHKFLLSMLSGLYISGIKAPQSYSGWVGRSLNYVSAFVL